MKLIIGSRTKPATALLVSEETIKQFYSNDNASPTGPTAKVTDNQVNVSMWL